MDLPGDYTEVLGIIKARIQQERVSAVMTANSAMVLLYWDIGHMILERQKYMRAFSAAWPDRAIVQGPLARITWYHNIALLEKVSTKTHRLWYASQAAEHGWSQAVLVLKIEGRAHLRHGKAVNNFKSTLPPMERNGRLQLWRSSRQTCRQAYRRLSRSKQNWAVSQPVNRAIVHLTR